MPLSQKTRKCNALFLMTHTFLISTHIIIESKLKYITIAYYILTYQGLFLTCVLYENLVNPHQTSIIIDK